jgi:hypothetical protein
MVVEQVPSVEDVAALRGVSKEWKAYVDGTFVTYWVQRLSVGEQFAASSRAGLWILERIADDRGFLACGLSSFGS